MAVALASATPKEMIAQAGGRSEIFAGSELENYVRLLQIDGKAALYPWSIRGFSPKEVDRLLAPGKNHPWARHFDLGPSSDDGFEIDLVHPHLTTYFNSTFPWGANNGPVWAGRGVTASLQAGVAARYGPVSLTLAPMVFSAQNAGFGVQDNGQTGNLRFADGRFPTTIDRPQRFGDGAYSRFDLGQTTLRLDLPLVALGASTANQSWGPARSPILLSNNAAGFPHVFLGSSSPIARSSCCKVRPTKGSSSSGSYSRSALIWDFVRIGLRKTGPGWNSKCAPIGESGVRMSWNIMIASTPIRAGSSEISVASSACRKRSCSSSPHFSRSLMYSGSDRPA